MKKKVISSLLILVAVFLMACQSGQTEFVSTEPVSNSEENSSIDVEDLSSEELSQEENTSQETVETHQSETIPTTEPQESSESVSEVEQPSYTITLQNDFMIVKKSVNVRQGPSSEYEKIGSLEKGTKVTVTGFANETGWFQIDFNGTTAYVSNKYLLSETEYNEMIAQEEAAALLAAQAALEQLSAQTALEQQASEATSQQTQQSGGELTQSLTDTSGFKGQVVTLMNTQRGANGVGTVTESSELDAAAQKRAEEIATYFSHSRPSGSDCFTVLDDYGIVYYTAGENIAAGQLSPDEVMNDWMNSEGHRANILNASFNKVGIGYYTVSGGYGTYWVQLFTD